MQDIIMVKLKKLPKILRDHKRKSHSEDLSVSVIGFATRELQLIIGQVCYKILQSGLRLMIMKGGKKRSETELT